MGPVLGAADSGVFTLDTRSGVTASVTLSGRVTDTTGSALANASVLAVSLSLVVASTISDASGNYTLPLLPPGTYELRAAKPDYLTGAKPTGSMSAGQAATFNFALAPRPDAPVVQ